ncbi:MAG: GNAT family N-acetyltransferase [Bacteroidales bacterium]|nr:GNAT family N-acetyltransferase [Bacteroidales bacterium]MDD3891880.1 GNAT family N-acetyltransferase [Bacteroidales bacterium]
MMLASQTIDIVPLRIDDLKQFIKSRAQFENKYNLKPSGLELNQAYKEELNEAVERTPEVWHNKSSDYLFHTLWVFIHRRQKVIIGQFIFNGIPNRDGEVEIFFSIEKPFRQNGYATEVVQAIMDWASQEESFKTLLVEADLNNKAAMASLKRVGFKRAGHPDDDNEVEITKYYKTIKRQPAIEELDFD